MLGIAINPAKDHPGIFQANLIIKNNTDKSLTFDPDQISMQFAHGVKNDTLAIYILIHPLSILLAVSSDRRYSFL